MNVPRSCCLFLLLTGLVSGCGGESPSTTYKATGIVTFEGKPVPGATVAFLGDGKVKPATALTGDDGRFVLSTYEAEDGAIEGEHVVTVTKAVREGEPAKELSMDEAAQQTEAQKPPEVKQVLPAIYGSPTQSPLKFTVTTDPAQNDFNIVLEKK